MKVDKIELAKKITQLKGIVPSKTTIEALKGILYKDGYLIADKNEMKVKAKIEVIDDATRIEPFIIPDKAFELIRSLPAGDVVITCEGTDVKIKLGKIKNQFKTFEAEKFIYSKDSVPDEEAMSIPADKLKTLISHVLYAVASTGSNQPMTGMFLHCENGKLNFVGLDGHRIAWDFIEYEGNLKLIIPKAALEKILSLDFNGDVVITHDKQSAVFKSDEYEVYTRLIAGEYFQYERMMQKGTLFTVVDRRVFIDAINRARLCGTAEDKAPVILHLENNNIRITYKNYAADYVEDVPTSVDFEETLRIGFDPKLLTDSLKAFDCDEVSIEFTSAKAPMFVKAGDSDMTALILPVEIKE